MRLLAFDTATEACSVALFEDGLIIAHDHSVIGRGHAEALLPAIARLPGGGRADIVRVGMGAGSFTGIRVAIAAARALAFAWNAGLEGMSTLALTAASGGSDDAEPRLVVMEGGHGEWLCQPFGAHGMPLSDLVSLAPDAAALRFTEQRVVGNRAAAFVAQRGTGTAQDVLPDARCALRVPIIATGAQVRPVYARAPDAKAAVAS